MKEWLFSAEKAWLMHEFGGYTDDEWEKKCAELLEELMMMDKEVLERLKNI